MDDDQGGAGVYRLLAGAAGLLTPIGSSGAVFAAIDIAARPAVQFHHGLEGKFNAGRGNSANTKMAPERFGSKDPKSWLGMFLGQACEYEKRLGAGEVKVVGGNLYQPDQTAVCRQPDRLQQVKAERDIEVV